MPQHVKAAFFQIAFQRHKQARPHPRACREAGNRRDQFAFQNAFHHRVIGGQDQPDIEVAQLHPEKGVQARCKVVAGARSFLPHGPLRAKDILSRDFSCRQRMRRRGVQAQPVAADGLVQHDVTISPAFHKSHIRMARDNGGGGLRGVAGVKVEFDCRMAQGKPRKEGRQPVCRHRLAGRDAQPAAQQAGQVVKGPHRIACRRQHGLCGGQEGMTCLVQFKASPDTMEQACAVAMFKRADCRTDGGLRQVERLRRDTHVQRPGNHCEDAKLFQGHPINIPYQNKKFNPLDLSRRSDDPCAMTYASRVYRYLPGFLLSLGVAGIAGLLQQAERAVTGRVWIESLVLAIAVGTVLRTSCGLAARFGAGVHFCAHRLLEMAVALMGVTIGMDLLSRAHPFLVLAIIMLVGVTVLAGILIGLAFGLPVRMAVLIACGNAICGNSAIAAIAPVIDADSDDVATSVAFTAVLGIPVVMLLPCLAHGLHLTETAGGTLAGLTVYAVPQVMAAAAPLGPVAVAAGTLAKLLRVLMLGPVVACCAFVRARRMEQERGVPRRFRVTEFLPPFILVFVGLMIARSVGLVPHLAVTMAQGAANALTLVAMAALGLGVDLRNVMAAGPRVVAVVTLSLCFLTTAAVLVVRLGCPA